MRRAELIQPAPLATRSTHGRHPDTAGTRPIRNGGRPLMRALPTKSPRALSFLDVGCATGT